MSEKTQRSYFRLYIKECALTSCDPFDGEEWQNVLWPVGPKFRTKAEIEQHIIESVSSNPYFDPSKYHVRETTLKR